MSTITTIAAGDQITSSRAVINTNFSNLNTDKMETSVLDTDTALTANSDLKVATQKAVKAYVNTGGNVNASTTSRGIVEEATQAEVDAGTGTGGTGARLFINPSTLTTKFSTTRVFDGSCPNSSYTDLNLSSVVGAKQRVVMLRVQNRDASSRHFFFKRNGETIDVTISTGSGGTSFTGGVAQDKIAYVIVTTDTSGIVEWTGIGASTSTYVDVEAYW